MLGRELTACYWRFTVRVVNEARGSDFGIHAARFNLGQVDRYSLRGDICTVFERQGKEEESKKKRVGGGKFSWSRPPARSWPSGNLPPHHKADEYCFQLLETAATIVSLAVVRRMGLHAILLCPSDTLGHPSLRRALRAVKPPHATKAAFPHRALPIRRLGDSIWRVQHSAMILSMLTCSCWVPTRRCELSPTPDRRHDE